MLVASQLVAQADRDPSGWSFDLHAGLAAPTSEIDGADLGAGTGFETNFAYRVLPHLAIYAAWDWHRFTPDEVLGQSDLDLEETGYAFGLRFDHPLAGDDGDGPSYRIRAGVTLNHIELEDPDGDIVDDSGHGVGYEVGAGVMFPLAGPWTIGPQVRFRSLGRELDVGDGTVDVDLSYLAFDVVWSLRF
jgi:opacity protein-like surface antigen